MKRFVKLQHYPQLVKSAWQHRYITASQIHEQFENIYGADDRKCRLHLQRLAQVGYLGIVPVASTSPNFPLVYYTPEAGLLYLQTTHPRDQDIQSAVATERFREHSHVFVLHELLVTQLDIAMRLSVHASAKHEILLHERRFFREDKQLEFTAGNTKQHLAPDSGFLIRTTQPGIAGTSSCLMYFVEMDNGSMDLGKLKLKFANYQRWAATKAPEYLNGLYSEHDRAYARPTFRVLVIAHASLAERDDQRLKIIYRALSPLPLLLRKNFWITTAQSLDARPQQDVLTAPIWLRASDEPKASFRRPLFKA